MLTVNDLHVYYGSIHAIKGVSFNVKEGEIVTLIGANGAGKTTILQTVSGLLKPRTGTIVFNNVPTANIKPHLLVSKGLAQVPEGRRIFTQLSVRDNIEMGAYTRNDKAGIEADIDELLLKFPRLKERHKQLAGTLSGGEQQMLAIVRALMSKPKLLLLDEPSMGLSPILVHEIFSILRGLNNDGMTILLVEQNAQMALHLADRAYVLETGKVLTEGRARALLDDDRIKEAYLGGI